MPSDSEICPTDEVLAFDPAIFHDFLAEHPDAQFLIISFTGEFVRVDGKVVSFDGHPIYRAITQVDGSATAFDLDPYTGAPVSTLELG